MNKVYFFLAAMVLCAGCAPRDQVSAHNVSRVEAIGLVTAVDLDPYRTTDLILPEQRVDYVPG